MKIYLISVVMVSEKILNFDFFFQKNTSQKLSMLEEKDSFEICIEFRIKWHKAIFNFHLFSNFFLCF